LAVQIAFVAPRPAALCAARQQRDAANPQPVRVALNPAGAQPEEAHERQIAHLSLR
jgi:hypothetical protein